MSRILWLLPVLLILPALVLVGGDDDAEPMRAAQSGGPDLLQIAERGDVSALDALLKRSADANMRDNCDWTQLMKAAVNGHVEAARRLLDAGAAVDAADKGGYTALLLAASNNHAELVDLLLAHSAMIDAQEQTQGYTPLIWAAHRGHTDTVQVLLQHGADATLPDFEGHAAAWHATAQGHAPVAALLSGSAAPATAQLGG
jgi:ankyrin repeat protein